MARRKTERDLTDLSKVLRVGVQAPILIGTGFGLASQARAAAASPATAPAQLSSAVSTGTVGAVGKGFTGMAFDVFESGLKKKRK